MKPGDEIRLLKDNLTFAVSLWKGAKDGRVAPGPLVRPGVAGQSFRQQAGASPPAGPELVAELTRSAANMMRGAFAVSALQAQRSLAVAFPGEPIQEEWLELRAARSAMYLIGRAVQRSILQPVWECPPPYRRLFQIRRFGFTLNATGLEGRVLSWDDFGGLERYISLLEYCASSANAAVAGGTSRTLPNYPWNNQSNFGGVLGAPDALSGDAGKSPGVVPPRGYPGDIPNRRLAPDAPPFQPPRVPDGEDDSWENAFSERADAWHTQPKAGEPPGPPNGRNGHANGDDSSVDTVPVGNMVSRFVAERCETGTDRRMLAGELYAGFLGWCQDSGRQPVSQRAFGMRLSGLGLRRKRRGHGKHWWEGIRLAGSSRNEN